MTEDRKEPYPTNDKQGGALSLLLRLFWMVIGNFVLFFIAFGIYSGEKALGLKDGIYWIAALLLIVARYIDVKYLDGLTAQGTPASMTHWYRYVAGLIICAGSIWGLARITNYFFV